MPTKRTARARLPTISVELDAPLRAHLELGDCLLAGVGRGCGCGLLGDDGVLHEALARRAWALHREVILSEWRGTQPPWAEKEMPHTYQA